MEFLVVVFPFPVADPSSEDEELESDVVVDSASDEASDVASGTERDDASATLIVGVGVTVADVVLCVTP